jgi:hypothetical protein
VVNEARFVTEEHRVYAKREELTVVGLLNLLFPLFLLTGLIHIEQITQALAIVKRSTHVALLFCQYLTFIFTQKRPLLDVFGCKETPHALISLLDSPDLQIVLTFLLFRHQKVVATSF